jgi:RNA polymerase sigma-70 factor, ECF subfamily
MSNVVMSEYAMVRSHSSSAPADQDQENSWISASQRGDFPAFNRLVLKWEKTVFNVALRLLQDREEAAEATQEVFLLAFKSIRRFRRDSKFSTWIYRIVVNHCLTRIKQRPPATYLPIEIASDTEIPAPQLQIVETQLDELMRREQRKRVRDALSHLPADQHAVIELKFFQELTFEEIAAVLAIPLSTVKSKLYSGIETLKIRLGAEA